MGFRNLVDKVFQLRVGVRNGVGEVNLGVGLFEAVLELKLVGLPIKAVSTVPFHKANVKGFVLVPI